MKLPHQTRSAFTVTELLVTTAIVGVLVAITIPAVMAARRSATTMDTSNKIRQLTMFAKTHEENVGGYGPSATEPSIISYHDILRANQSNYAWPDNAEDALPNMRHYPTARGYGLRIPSTNSDTGRDDLFLDSAVPTEALASRHGGIGVFMWEKDKFSPIDGVKEVGRQHTPLFATIETNTDSTNPPVDPNSPFNDPTWRAWFLNNQGINPVDSIANDAANTFAGFDFKRHNGVTVIGFSDGSVRLLGLEETREISDAIRKALNYKTP